MILIWKWFNDLTWVKDKNKIIFYILSVIIKMRFWYEHRDIKVIKIICMILYKLFMNKDFPLSLVPLPFVVKIYKFSTKNSTL